MVEHDVPASVLGEESEAINSVVEVFEGQPLAGSDYEMMLFEEKEIEGYLTHMIAVEHSIYDHIEYESEVE